MTRINFTGRRRIAHTNVKLRVRAPEGTPLLDVIELNLDRGLPDDAAVVVEAYRETVLMRFSAGTVGRLTLPSGLALSDFDSPEVIRFRIKVVGAGTDSGKILAAADKLRAHAEGDDAPHTSLLPIAPERLGQVLWRVSFSDDEPKLLVNREVGDWKGFAMNPTFQAFVLPEALRQIGAWVLKNRDDHEEGGDSPLDLWIALLSSLGYDPTAAETEEADWDLWLDELVGHFGRRFRFRELVADIIGGTDE